MEFTFPSSYTHPPRQQVDHHALFLVLELVAVGFFGADAGVVGVDKFYNALLGR